MSDRLAIPLNSQPARHKLWRALGALSLIVGAILLGFFIDRAVLFRTSVHAWPNDATAEIRFIKTPSTVEILSAQFGTKQVLPGTPWDLAEILTWTKRELILFTIDNELIGLSVDGNIPNGSTQSLSNYGWKMVTSHRRTLIVSETAPTPTTLEKQGKLWWLWPAYDGDLTYKTTASQKTTLPISLSQDHLDMRLDMSAFIPTAHLVLPEKTALLGSFSLPPVLSTAFFPVNFNRDFPGLQLLSDSSADKTVDLLLGHDVLGTSLALSVPATGLSLEELGAIASEMASLQNLSTLALTNDTQLASQEIKSTSETVVELENTAGLNVAVAKTLDGRLVRLTQSDAQLILSNRPAQIEQTSAPKTSLCLKNSAGFIKPQQLADPLEFRPDQPAWGLLESLKSVPEIAYRKKHLRICW